MNSSNKLDRVDIKILAVLQSDARITNQALAATVNLSPSTCLVRVKKLEDSRVIESYRGVINLTTICRSITCLATVKLQNHAQEDFRAFEKFIHTLPEIIECYTVSGEFDFLLKVICPDMQNYLVLNEQLIEQGDYTVTIQTHVVMNENKRFSGYPLEKLL